MAYGCINYSLLIHDQGNLKKEFTIIIMGSIVTGRDGGRRNMLRVHILNSKHGPERMNWKWLLSFKSQNPPPVTNFLTYDYLYLLHFPNSDINQGPSTEMPEILGDISLKPPPLSTYHKPYS